VSLNPNTHHNKNMICSTVPLRASRSFKEKAIFFPVFFFAEYESKTREEGELGQLT
jgi:hypothetical protein